MMVDNNELIKQARELCEKVSTEKANGNAVDSAALSWAIVKNIVPQLCDALEAAQRWIPVKDPPKYTGDYNVVCNIGSMLGGYTDVRTYRFERFKGKEPKWCIPNRFDEIVSVTHWQPLPQPPQKGETNGNNAR